MFDFSCRSLGYIQQMAFYRAVYREATGETLPIHIVAVEKREPFSTGVWEIAPNVLDDAEHINEASLKRLRECRLKNEWPTGYEDVRIINSL